jgi:hypothetical protein
MGGQLSGICHLSFEMNLGGMDPYGRRLGT